MKLRTCSVVLLSFLVLSSQLLAFDGQRKGFILGGGIGGGYLHYTEPFLGLNKFAVATNFKIGYAPSNTLEIYYINSASWFAFADTTFIIGVSGVGLTKYLNPNGTGFFVCGGIGVSVLQALESGAHSTTGAGFLGGVGYEFAKHWNLQADVAYTTMESGSIKSLAVKATLNVLAF